MKIFIILFLGISQTIFAQISKHDLQKYCHYYKYDNCTLIQAIIEKESSYNEMSYHPENSGSYGLMQIQCSLAKKLGLKYGCYQLFNPQINIRFGILYLKYIEKRLIKPIDIREILSIYNGGFSRHLITIGNKKYIQAKRCQNKQIFRYKGFPTTICYPGEYINEFYVWKTYRLYKYLMQKELINKE